MIKDPEKKPRQPFVISDDEDEDISKIKPSKVGTFSLQDMDDTDTIESITGINEIESDVDYTKSTNKTSTLKKLKWILLCVVTYALLLFAYNTYSLITSAWEFHWSFGAFIVSLVVSILVTLTLSIVSWLKEPASLSEISFLQSSISELRETTSIGHAKPILASLEKLYNGMPQEAAFTKARNTLKDYHNDAEVINIIDNNFFIQLDKQAIKRVNRCSLEVGIGTAFSPFPALDMVINLWRNFNMVSDIILIYGVNPSLRNRFRILIRVFNNMAISGVADAGFKQLFTYIGQNPFFGRASEGLTNAVTSYVLGTTTIEICRPIPYKKDAKSQFQNFKDEVYKKFKRRTTPDVDATKEV